MRIYLILSESPFNSISGGTTAAHDRLNALLSISTELSAAFIDWDKNHPSPFSINKINYYPIHPEYKIYNPISKVINAIALLIKSWPWFKIYFKQDSIIDKLCLIVRDFNPDIICFDNIISTAIWDSFSFYNRIYFAHNVESDVVQYSCGGGNIKSALERFKMKFYERKILSTANAVIFYTERDYQKLKKYIGFGCLKYVIPPAFALPLEVVSSKRNQDEYIILPTNAKWIPNKKSLNIFLNKCVPFLDKNICIYITGADSDGFLSNIAEKNVNIKYLGLLNRTNYEDVFKSAKLFINPTLYGSGFQIKIIEAIRFNVPVVSTSFSNPFVELICSSDNFQEMANIINDHMSNARVINIIDYNELYCKTSFQLSQAFSDIKLAMNSKDLPKS